MKELKRSDYIIRNYRNGDEREIVEILKESFGNQWGNIDDWIWKHKTHPNFSPKYIFIAENNGRIVGCSHIMIQNMKMIGSSDIKMSMGGDIAILTDFRRRGIGPSLMKAADQIFREQGVTIRIGYSGFENNSQYFNKLGYVAIPNKLVIYKKILRPKFFEEKICSLNEALSKNEKLRKKLKRLNLAILFRLNGLQPFMIKIDNGNIIFEERVTDSAEMVIDGCQSFLGIFQGNGLSRLNLFKTIFLNKLRIKGIFSNGLKLYKFFKIVRYLNSTRKLN